MPPAPDPSAFDGPFGRHLAAWGLTVDGAPIVTHAGRLLPVRRRGAAAMLKVSTAGEERRGAEVMAWWNGRGAARVLAHDGAALLMERAEGSASLSEMARTGRDDEATLILCAAAVRLHAARPGPAPRLAPLREWFRELEPAARAHGGVLRRALDAARALLDEPRDVVALHGDLHHGNVLDFGPRGWLAIDPKGLRGERGYDFGNIFLNPVLDDPSRPVATDPARFRRRAGLVAEAAGIERGRLLAWVLARAGLTAAWYFDQDDARLGTCAAVAGLAAAELDG